ncbi:MAG: inositol monophosphatase family protein [Ruegeria sp.]
MSNIAKRKEFAVAIAEEAGAVALSYFAKRDNLIVDQKGAQDWVSEADRNVETFIRQKISETFPGDGLIGEEHGEKVGSSGFDWVIDPIDGTTNFVNGIPAWTIVLAGVSGASTQFGVIHEPNVGETYAATKNAGATLNGRSMRVASNVELASGTISVGYSNRVEAANVIPVIEALIERGALYHRNASGALSLAYVAAGRLLGYVEEHMNAWDCLAGQLMVAEAGGLVETQDAKEMIRVGGRVIAGPPKVFETLMAICDKAWGNDAN